MELMGYLAIARRWWWTLVMATWIAAISGFLASSQIPPTYDAMTRLLVGPISSDFTTLRASGSLAQTYAELVTSEPVMRPVIDELGLAENLEQLAALVRAVANESTRLLTIQVSFSDAEAAARIANALAAQLTEINTASISRPEGALTVIDPAQAPEVPTAPDVIVLVALAALVGLVGALILVLALEYFSDAIKDRHSLVEATDVNFLGSIQVPPSFRGTLTQPLVVEHMPESRTAMAYRLVAMKIALSDREAPAQTILVVGTGTSDGSGEVALNLAAVLARSGRRVTVVDGNDDDAEISQLVTYADRPGVDELLRQDPDSVDAAAVERIKLRRAPGIEILPRLLGEPHLVDVKAARRLIAVLLESTDTVIINVAAIQRSGSALVWARLVETSALVVRKDQSTRESVRHAVESLRLVGAEPGGVILVDRRGTVLGSRRGRRGTREMARPGDDAVDAGTARS